MTQLKKLEQAGIVRRAASAELPPRVEYLLVDNRQTLLPIIDQLSAWHSASPVAAPGPPEAMLPHCA